MPEWWTYSLEDFLLFSPRTYRRMVELHNAAVWPLQVAAWLAGAAILAWTLRPRPWSGRAVAILAALAWAWVAWSFLWHRYATINWAAAYAVPAFGAQAALLAWVGGVRGRLRFTAAGLPGAVGLVLFLHALVLHPLLPFLAGRAPGSAELFGIAPDPTAIATLGLAAMAGGGARAWLLLAVPAAWCLVSAATLHAMAAPEAWIPLAAAGLAAAALLIPRGGTTA